jgi:hypothetical protein
LLSGTLQPRGRRPLARAGVAFSQERADGRARAHQAGPEAQVRHPARIAAQLVHPAVAVTGQTRKGKAPHQTPKLLNGSSTKSALPLILNSTRDFFWVLYVVARGQNCILLESCLCKNIHLMPTALCGFDAQV